VQKIFYKIKNVLKSSIIFNKLFFFFYISIYKTKENYKSSIKKNLKDFKLNASHINSHQNGVIINKLLDLLDIKNILFSNDIINKNNFLKSEIQIFFDQILKKKNQQNIDRIFINELKKINKNNHNLAFAIFLIYFGNFKLKSIITNIDCNNDQLKISNFLYEAFLLKNLPITNLDSKEKLKLTKKFYYENLKNFEALKILEISTEHSLSDRNLLFLIKNRIKKLKNTKCKNKKYYGSSLYAFGHLINFIEIMHRQDNLNFNNKKKIIISPYFIANSYLALYLKIKYKNRIEINHKKFMDIIKKNQMDKSINYEEIDNKYSIYNLSYAEFKKKNYITGSIDKRILEKIDKKFKLKPYRSLKKFVLINLRVVSFKSYDKFISVNNDRYLNPAYLEKFIITIISYGYKVIILNGNTKININDKDFFYYSKSKIKNDYNDINLIKDCAFIVNFGQTATTALPLMFNKFSLNIDYPLNRKPIFDNKSYFLVRPMVFKKKKVKINEYLNNTLYINHDFKILEQKGYEIEETQFKLVIKKLIKFIEFISDNKKLKLRIFKFKYPVNIL
jgi:hypothetical protein